MRLFFADDSGSRKKGWFCVGAFSVHANDFRTLTETLWAIKRSFNIPMDAEVKMNHVGATKNNPLIEAGYLTEGERAQFPARLLAAVTSIPSFRSICVGVEVASLRKPVKDPLDWACQFLFERCQFLLQQEGTKSGLLVFDNEKERKRDIEAYLKDGSYYLRPTGFSEPPAFYSSSKSPGLQVADFVAGAAHRYWNADHETYLRLLWPSLYRKGGSPLGSGLKSMPASYPNW